MARQLVIKPEKCVSCRTCELVCSFGHNQRFNPRESSVSVMDYEDAAVSIPVMCLQCEDPACLKVCPVHAISRNESGVVVVNYQRCIGCKLCVNACPMGNMHFSLVSRRVFKCDLCGGDPLCAKYCPGKAIVFVDERDDSDRKQAVAEQFKNVFGGEVQE